MKKIILAVFFVCQFSFLTFSAPVKSTVRTINVNGINRTYRLYVPAMYNGTKKVPLVFNMHGKTSSAQEQESYGDFRKIADTANFILVHPQGMPDELGVNTWNVNDSELNPSDIDFISKLIDNLKLEFNINSNRIYMAGLSFGGTMSYKLACELSSKITAIACVSGTMNFSQKDACNPTHIMPIMQIQGTADPIIPYDGSNNFLSMSEIVAYWAGINQCNTSNPEITSIPNISLNDGSTAKKNKFLNGSYGLIELYKVIGGGHSWPGSPFYIDVTNEDFYASKVIWNFFKQYKLNGLAFSQLGIMQNDDDEVENEISYDAKNNGVIVESENKAFVKSSPNPFSNEIVLQLENFKTNTEITVRNILGQMIELNFNSKSDQSFSLNTTDWKEGIYIISTNDNGIMTHTKIVKK